VTQELVHTLSFDHVKVSLLCTVPPLQLRVAVHVSLGPDSETGFEPDPLPGREEGTEKAQKEPPDALHPVGLSVHDQFSVGEPGLPGHHSEAKADCDIDTKKLIIMILA
jgi:hypothetical protein